MGTQGKRERLEQELQARRAERLVLFLAADAPAWLWRREAALLAGRREKLALEKCSESVL